MYIINLLTSTTDLKTSGVPSAELLGEMGDSRSGTRQGRGLVWDILLSPKASNTQRKRGSCEKGTRARLHWFPLPHLQIPKANDYEILNK